MQIFFYCEREFVLSSHCNSFHSQLLGIELLHLFCYNFNLLFNKFQAANRIGNVLSEVDAVGSFKFRGFIFSKLAALL